MKWIEWDRAINFGFNRSLLLLLRLFFDFYYAIHFIIFHGLCLNSSLVNINGNMSVIDKYFLNFDSVFSNVGKKHVN